MDEKRCRSILTGKGLKNTKTRAQVLMVLDNTERPLTVDEIFLEIKKKDTSANLSTVYRTMDTLFKNALIIKTALLDDSRSRYEINRMEHRHHLVCTNCNRMIPVDGCPVDEYAKKLCNRSGFELTGHRLEIYGICANCKKGVRTGV